MPSAVLGFDAAALNELKTTINSDIRNALNPTVPAPASTLDKLDHIIILLERLNAKLDAFPTTSPPIATFVPAPSPPVAATQPSNITSPEGIPTAATSSAPPTFSASPCSPFDGEPAPVKTWAELSAPSKLEKSQAHRQRREGVKLRQVDLEDGPHGKPSLLQSIVPSFQRELSPEEIRLEDYRYDLRYAPTTRFPDNPFVFSPKSSYTPSDDAAPAPAKHPLTPPVAPVVVPSTTPTPLFSFDPTLPPFASTSKNDAKPAGSPRLTQPDFFAATLDSERYFFGLPNGKMRSKSVAEAGGKKEGVSPGGLKCVAVTDYADLLAKTRGQEWTAPEEFKFSADFGKVAAENSLSAEVEIKRRVVKEDSPTESKEGTSTPDLLSRPPSSTVPSPPSESVPTSPPPSFAFGQSTTSPAAPFTFASPPPLDRKKDEAIFSSGGTLFGSTGAKESTSTPASIDRATSTTPTPIYVSKTQVFAPRDPTRHTLPRPAPPTSPSTARSSTPVASTSTTVPAPTPDPTTASVSAPTSTSAAVSITPLYVPSLPPSGTRSFGGRSSKPPSLDAPSETSTPGIDRSRELSLNGGFFGGGGSGGTGMYAGGWGGRAIKKSSSEIVPPAQNSSNHPSPTRVFVGKSSKGTSGKGGGIGNGIINNHPRTKPRPRMRSSLSGSSLGTGSMTPIQEWVQGADAGGEATWVEEEIVFVSREEGKGSPEIRGGGGGVGREVGGV